jgi:hypothetical protein
MMVGSNVNGVKYAGAIIGVVASHTYKITFLGLRNERLLQIGGGAISGIIASTVFRRANAPKYLPGLAVVEV